ncbi:MAG: methyl-accepting chemotaxis protein [Treponema sp.]|jgi:methyl-accepting chemotaxis protein|nr:methyl-accepting chemotaxis protein [Treponema sp.]
MKLKVKFSLIVISLLTAVILSSSIILLSRASSLQIEAAHDHVLQVAHTNAVDIQRRMESYMNTIQTVGQIFTEYHTLPAETRRDNFDDILLSLMNVNPNYTGMWTAWHPNALDGMDDQYRNAAGSNERGQYISAYTRRNGYVEPMPQGFENWETFLGSMGTAPIVTDPVWRRIKRGAGDVPAEDVPVVTIIYPILDRRGGGRLLGIVGMNYISLIQSYVDEISRALYDGAGVAGVYTNSGVIIGHFDRSRVKSRIQENQKEQDLLGAEQLARVVSAIKNGGIDGGNPLTVTRYSSTLQTDMYNVYYPIQISGVSTPWCIVTGIPMSVVTQTVRSLMIFTGVFALAAIIAAAAVAFLVTAGVVKPVISVTLALKDISEGEGDLTRSIKIQAKDEIGDLARYFNLTLEKIRNLVITIKEHSLTLLDIGNDLASSMAETAAAVNQITANVQSIKGRVINQSASVTETKATMEQITVNIDRLNSQVERQTASVSQSSSAIEEMLANIQSVTNTLIKNGANVQELSEASESGRSGLQEVAADIREIARESEGLLEINAVMENIASQTNLLSMNAAIEAAHAGEAGKGFAVVADEIRKLAESSGEQSKTISMVLKRIKESIDKITKSTDTVLNRFEAIDTDVRTVADQETNIRNAMEEQSVGSKQILEALGQLNDITFRVKGGSEEMLEGSKEVIHESKNLELVSQEISNGMNEMSVGADQINVAVHAVNTLSNKNRDHIDILVKEVSRFKVD